MSDVTFGRSADKWKPTTTVVYRLSVDGAPTMVAGRGKPMRPTAVVATFHDGTFHDLVISGPNVKRDGADGAVEVSEDWSAPSWNRSGELYNTHQTPLPAWARPLLDYATATEYAEAARLPEAGE